MIGAGLQVAGSIFGGIFAAKAAKKKENALKNKQARNDAWYNKNYYADATQRADAQRILTRMEDKLMSANRRAAATAAVAGGTEEAAAAAKEASTAAIADTMSQMAVAAEARKDGIEEKYMAKKEDLDNQMEQVQAEKAKAVTDAVQGAIKGVASAASSF